MRFAIRRRRGNPYQEHMVPGLNWLPYIAGLNALFALSIYLLFAFGLFPEPVRMTLASLVPVFNYAIYLITYRQHRHGYTITTTAPLRRH